MIVTDLDYNQTLSVSKGTETVTWKKLQDSRSIFKFRRYHYKGKKLVNVMDNHKLGSAENLDLEFLLDTGWKRV